MDRINNFGGLDYYRYALGVTIIEDFRLPIEYLIINLPEFRL
jgi:hypothetical protein